MLDKIQAKLILNPQRYLEFANIMVRIYLTLNSQQEYYGE